MGSGSSCAGRRRKIERRRRIGGLTGLRRAALRNQKSITFSLRRNGNKIAAVGPRQATETKMDKEHVKGTADKAKGAIKDTAGKVTGDEGLQTEGKIDKAKGSAHKAAG